MSNRRGGSPNLGYHVRRTPEGVYSITLPRDMGVVIPSDKRFKAEFTPEGILFRIVDEPTPAPKYVPEWTMPF